MKHPLTIAGKPVEIEWTQETAKRFAFRMGTIGGEPRGKDFTNPRKVESSLFKVLWGLLPSSEFAKYEDAESLFVAVDHETEGEAIFAAINGIYADRFPDEEKKSTSMKSPSPESNSE